PGYDPVSVTGIVAGGANVVCFTTGRGGGGGGPPPPPPPRAPPPPPPPLPRRAVRLSARTDQP
ncbi:UxaA family hydrolase, partial [Saccharopolyspora soli]|uniref:UxaA family hydrolase n=1 Tax=Saccharopolyspora soli TaxID=2926618 RepID=UPI0024133917